MRARDSIHLVAWTLSALLLATPAVAPQGFTPRDVARLRSAASAVISPDGERVAYLLVVPREPLENEDGAAWSELHVVDSDGSSRAFVGGHVNVSQIAWTPDGRGITFLAKRDGDDYRSLYVIPLAGGESRRLVTHGANVRSYALASDGKRVAFLANEPDSEAQEKLDEQGFDQIIYEEDWRAVRVWIAEPDTEQEPRLLEHDGSASTLRFSPDGTKLALALAPTSLVDHSYTRRRLTILDATEGTVLARFENPGKLGDIVWSPDGQHIAFISAADANDPMDGRLMVAPAAGGGMRELMPSYDDGHVSGIRWVDENTLSFVMQEGVETFTARIGADGSRLEKLIPKGEVVVSRLSLSKDGSKAAFVGQRSSHPREVFYVTSGEKPRRLTNSNPWLEQIELAKQEVVDYEARDGMRLEGILIRPLNEQPGRRYPLIVNVHGGPESHYSNGWLTAYSQPGQTAAARGFAVFYPNYRGSTGRGVEFSKHGHADAAGPEFDDLVDAVDHLVEIGLVDRDKVGITGGSYGGYASAWGATYYSERFAASVMFVGISNNISKVGTTDIPEEMYLVHHRKWLFDDWDYFLKRSPIYYAEKGRTPILILHGDEDPRVHPSQSMELYRHLKNLGQTPVRLVFYRGEGHGNRRAASRFDYNLRMLRWMEHYLLGPGGDPPDYHIAYEQAMAPMSATTKSNEP